MDLQLEGRRALVTGGSRGIGKAIARQLALEGASVAIAARNPQVLLATAQELTAETGTKIATIVADTSQDESVRRMVDETVTHLGGLDILVNSAALPGGQTPPPKLADLTDEIFWSDMNVKVMGYLRCAREAAPHMVASGWGRIINISGLAARHSVSIVGSMRNVSVSALTKNLADELGPQGINVTVVHPGITATEKIRAMLSERARTAGLTDDEMSKRMASNIAIGRIVDVTEVADIVAFLASPRSVAINGDAIACGGGIIGSIYY